MTTRHGLPPAAAPFLSSTFPLLLSDQLAASPSTQVHNGIVPTPSPLIIHPLALVKQKKLSHAGEKRVRALYITLIQKAGRLLELPNLVIATACVYWHRFFSLHSLLVYHPSLCAGASIFLASKVEENSRRVRDVINTVHRVEYMTRSDGSMHPNTTAASATPSHQHQQQDEPLQVSQLFWDLKDEVLRFEQKLLRVMNFEMKIFHPHLYVLHFARELECSEEVCRVAYYLANDSLKGTLCLQYTPNAIACACIYLSSEMMQEQIRFHPAIIKDTTTTGNTVTSAAALSPYRSPHPSTASSAAQSASVTTSVAALISTSHSSEWWEYFGKVNQLEVEDIAHQLIDLLEDDFYTQLENDPPPPSTQQHYQHQDDVLGSIHQELRRIAEEEDRIQTQQHTASRTTQHEQDDHMDDVEAQPQQRSTPQANRTLNTHQHAGSGNKYDAPSSAHRRASVPAPMHSTQTSASAGMDYPSYGPSSSAAATSGSTDKGSAGKMPQRLQLGAYASQPRAAPLTYSSASSAGPPSSYPSYAPSMPTYGTSMMHSSGGPTSYSSYAPPSAPISNALPPAGPTNR